MDLQKDLMQAIYDGTEEKVRTLIASHGFSHTVDGGYSLLVKALNEHQFAIAKVLITSCVQVNNKALQQQRCDTPLQMAVYNRQMDIVEMLLDRGADLGVSSCLFRNAIQSENLEFFELLLNRGIDLNAQGPDGLRPLHLAAMEGKKDAVLFLLSYGVDIDASSTDNKTALYFAAEETHLDVVKLLLQLKPHVRNEGNRAALYAAIEANVNKRHERHECAKRFSTESFGWCIEILARQQQRSQLKRLIFAELVDYGFIYELEPGCDSNFFHGAIELGFLEIVEDLLAYGADANMHFNGQTALLLAMKKELTDVAELLVFYGADVNAQDGQKKSPIYYAAESGNAKLVKILLTHGATVSGYPDVMEAAISGRSLKIVKELLKNGADVNMDSCGDISLLRARKRFQKTNMSELLVSYGTDVNALDGKKKKPIYFAATDGRTKLVKLLVSHGAIVSGYPDVMEAAISGRSLKIVKKLLKNGADPNVDYDGDTPLLMAIKTHQPDIAEFLVFNGADVNTKDKQKKTPVYYAAKYGRTKLVKFLLNHGAIVSGYPDVMEAAISGRSLEIVKELLKYGADPNVDYDGETPLLLAIQADDLSLVEDLLKNGANANYKEDNYGETPLLMAVKRNQPDFAELLISYSANVNTQDRLKKTPIHYAAQYGSVKLFNVVLTHGATISDYPHVVHAAISGKSPEIVEKLLNLGYVHINDCTYEGTPALLASLLESSADVTALLLEKGADVNVRCGNNDDTLLHVLSARGDHRNCETILRYGAAVGSKNKEGRTPLHCADNAEIVKVLIHSGADINARDLQGWTPLQISVKEEGENVVDALLKFDADVDSTDKKGKTALHLACQSLEAGIVRLLLNYGADINICDNYHPTTMNRVNSYYLRRVDTKKVKQIIMVIFFHIDKMEMINLYVSDKNLAVKSQAEDLPFLSENVLANRRQLCKEEIGKLQTTEINNSNVTYYQFLTKNSSSVAVLLGNENILQAFQPGNANAKEFRNFNPLLNLQFRKAIMVRKGLVEQCYEVFGFLCHELPLLPTCCVEEIFQNFSNKDLKMFAAVRGPLRQCSNEDEFMDTFMHL